MSEWKGPFCGVSDEKAVVIADEAEWRKVWKAAFGDQEVPAVDFTRQVAAAVFLGTQRTGGYAVEFSGSEAQGENTVLRYSVKSPGPGMFVIQALTQPFAIRLFPKPPGPVELQAVKR